MRTYTQVLDTNKPLELKHTHVTREHEKLNIGEKSDDSLCNAKDFYLDVKTQAPDYDPLTQRKPSCYWEFENNTVVQKWRDVVDIPLEELYKKEVATVDNAIDDLIQTEIVKYNTENGTTFKHINSIPKYTIDETYTHYDFCVKCLAWNLSVFEEARLLQKQIETGARPKPSSLEQFLNLLPKLAL